ncbi:MAG: DivIVA domain-containing protein [Winkia neuii]|uniref:DivIVA domain-containing protein n=1 Tax=Winkia neuii TaxID=33007 RepID=UPI00241EDC06|nr:DivIVA domain-containing protein [Winkia neuii]MBS5947452.1 DivIVA domain-containing protein [Winkia neuii]
MALLTAEDVHYKTFTPTKFREGYDQDEVDSFLDEVVRTLTALQEGGAVASENASEASPAAADDGALRAENDKLRAELEQARKRTAEVESEAAEARKSSGEPSEAEAQLRAQIEQLRAENEKLRTEAETARSEAQKAAEAPAPSQSNEPESATSMLAMAQRLHDEYVHEGQEKGNKIVDDAHAQSQQILREAKDEKTRVINQLDSERSMLEGKINELEGFESEYRSQLRSHLQKLIETVDADDIK